MQKQPSTPIWVYLAFSSINSRKAAIWLIAGCLVFSVYCVPWSTLADAPAWVARLFLIDDWSWFAMMLPMTAWYWLSLKWMDRNQAW